MLRCRHCCWTKLSAEWKSRCPTQADRSRGVRPGQIAPPCSSHLVHSLTRSRIIMAGKCHVARRDDLIHGAVLFHIRLWMCICACHICASGHAGADAPPKDEEERSTVRDIISSCDLTTPQPWFLVSWQGHVPEARRWVVLSDWTD